jgi:hypothetical protein
MSNDEGKSTKMPALTERNLSHMNGLEEELIYGEGSKKGFELTQGDALSSKLRMIKVRNE